MIASMTGYGRGVGRTGGVEVDVEIRAVNNRFLDISLKVPRLLGHFEQQIRESIGKHIKRGRISVWISVNRDDNNMVTAKLNRDLVRAYLEVSKQLQNEYNIHGKLDVGQLLAFPDIFQLSEEEEADATVWNCTQDALTQALKMLQNMRAREGKELEKDFLKRINNLELLVTSIEDLAQNEPMKQFAKLKARVEKIITNEQVDEGRLEAELALIADRIDVTEECVRFHSHNKLFLEMLQDDESQGRKLNFLLQEMNREANTIGVKAASPQVSHLMVEIKEDVERIREQIQNIE